ncbi:MAG TPA: response regulator [Chloroflexia bacterium]|nr:response regulator [Chloroflexia bacterium]
MIFNPEVDRLQNLSQSGTRGTVLIIEDSSDIRALLVELLEDEGYHVFEAASGEDGIVSAVENRPGIILLDLSLPGINGWETCRRLRALPEITTTPIVALTAHSAENHREMALQAGCNGFINKPFDVDVLLNQVATFISQG